MMMKMRMITMMIKMMMTKNIFGSEHGDNDWKRQTLFACCALIFHLSQNVTLLRAVQSGELEENWILVKREP